MFIVQPVTEHLFHWTSTDINTKIKLIIVQNYGWPTGPAKIWLWLARRPFGWPRATGPAGSTTPDHGWPDSKKAAMAGTYNNDVFQHIGRYSADVLHKILTWQDINTAFN